MRYVTLGEPPQWVASGLSTAARLNVSYRTRSMLPDTSQKGADRTMCVVDRQCPLRIELEPAADVREGRDPDDRRTKS
jgi:hypothetical protein